MKCNSRDVWNFLPCRRLLFTARVNSVAAPLPGLLHLRVHSRAGEVLKAASTGILVFVRFEAPGRG